MNPIELGKFIASLRNEKNLTQEELADKLFIDKRKVSRWECGTSIPEFEMLMKLTEIFDVSLYELSICKRITNDKLNRKVINKFKSIKDFKKYKIKRLVLIIVFILLIALFIKMTIYTFKNSGNIKIYKLESLDNNVNLVGNVININDDYLINVTELLIKDNSNIVINSCIIDILNDNQRVFYVSDTKKIGYNPATNFLFFSDEIHDIKFAGSNLKFIMSCKDSKKSKISYTFDTKLIEKFNNNFL